VAYRNVDSNISSSNLNGLLEDRSNPSGSSPQSGPLNILVAGTDSRLGEGNSAYGNPEELNGVRSDTTLLVHVSEDRSNALVVSIPRDTLVDIPSCPQWEGPDSEPLTDERFNEAYKIGGVGCTLLTVEQITGADIDHFVVVDFNGFKGMVEALDGVEVCLTQPVDDPLSGLQLPAGTSTVKGEDALAFVRARYTLGDGSDIGRIERQQAFIASVVRKATSLQILTNPSATYRLLDSATKSIYTDTGIGSLADMTDLALSMSDMRPEDVTFVTAPFYYNDDGNTVSIDETAAEPIWQALRDDTPWPPPPTVPPGDDLPLTVAPSQIQVRVLNGTGQPGVATEAAAELTRAGYEVVEIGDYAPGLATATEVVYPAGSEEAARTLGYATRARSVEPGDAAALLANPSLFTDTPEALTLVIGPGYRGIRAVVVPQPADPAGTPQGTTDPQPNTGTDAGTVVCS